METLFRFNVLRGTHRSEDEVSFIPLAANTPFQTSAAALPAGDTRRRRLKELAAAFIASPAFVDRISDDENWVRLEAASTAVDELVARATWSRESLLEALRAALGAPPAEILAKPEVVSGVPALKDSILAIKLSPADHGRPMQRLVAILRAIELLRRVESDPDFPASLDELVRVHRQGLRIAEAVLPAAPRVAPRPQPPTTRERIGAISERHRRFEQAIAELRAIRPSGFAKSTPKESKGVEPMRELSPEALLADELALRREVLRAVFEKNPDGSASASSARTTDLAALGAAKWLADGFSFASSDHGAASGQKAAAASRSLATGTPAFKPTLPGLLGLRLTPESIARLSPATREVLREQGLDPSEPIARAVALLMTEKQRIHADAHALLGPAQQKTFRTIGGTTVAITSSIAASRWALSLEQLLDVLPGLALDPTMGVPETHADVRPAGNLHLHVVRQQLKGYEGAEVSHVLNVLKGERKERVSRNRLETEVLTTSERETESVREKSLEVADRFEVKRETERAVEEEAGVQGSAEVKVAYGPTVEFRASVEASWQRRSEEAERAAVELARNVTQKAMEKVTERALDRETRRVTRLLEETDAQAFDNAAGTGHVSGVYQWMTKVYEAQVFDYGLRTVYDLMVPEPAAMLLSAFQTNRSAAIDLQKPPAFELIPGQLTEDNYQHYVALYGATDVQPPPLPYVTAAYDNSNGGASETQRFASSAQIQVPEGYRAIQASVAMLCAVWNDWRVACAIGQRAVCFQPGFGTWVWTTPLDEETSAVPFAMVTSRVADYAAAVEVICEATDRAWDLWKASTHAKLVQAYRTRLSEYETRLAELEAEAPPTRPRLSSARNRSVMAGEVKRLCISALTKQHFDRFDSIREGRAGLPEIDFSEYEAEGRYARFFEQAFEWENVSWVPYAYFWGRKSGWSDKITIEDDDAEFEAFLKAGFLRVQIPVRPGFAAALDHFRLFGEPWQGAGLPPISDGLYLPIADEIAERMGRPGGEIPVGEPWEVRVPTSLVRLRAADDFPAWRKSSDGTWAETS